MATSKDQYVAQSQRQLNSYRWTDISGVRRKCPPYGKKLRLAKVRSHQMLRLTVFMRDGFACQACGALPALSFDPLEYDGRSGISVYDHGPEPKQRYLALVVDHIIGLPRGGSNHPSNLQALCDSCNAHKGSK